MAERLPRSVALIKFDNPVVNEDSMWIFSMLSRPLSHDPWFDYFSCPACKLGEYINNQYIFIITIMEFEFCMSPRLKDVFRTAFVVRRWHCQFGSSEAKLTNIGGESAALTSQRKLQAQSLI
jgi:hypothetical protein